MSAVEHYHSIAVDGWGSETTVPLVIDTLNSRAGLVVQQTAEARVSVSRTYRPWWSPFRRTAAGEVVVADGPRGCVVTVPPVVDDDTKAALRRVLVSPSTNVAGPAFTTPPAHDSDLDGRTVARSALALDPGAAPTAPTSPTATLHFPGGAVTVEAGESVVLGRDPEAPTGARAVVVPGDNATVSKSHLRVHFDGQQLTVEDLHSKNGSAIDQHGQLRVLSPGTPIASSIGDRIEIGATCFVVQ